MRLFDNITELSSSISFQISNESDIASQLNDAFIPMFTDEVRKLQNYARSKSREYDKVQHFEKDKNIQQHLRKMCDLIADRFGINFDIIFEKEYYNPNIAVFNLPVNDASLTYTMNTKDIVKYYGNNKLSNLDKVLVDFCKNIEDQLKKSAIIVDYSKAKIKGIPKEAKNVIIISVPLLIDVYGEFTAEELVGGFLHEIGHVFFHYLYCYNTYSKTLSLTQGMLDYVNDKNKHPKEALVLSYVDVTNDKSILEYKNKNPIFLNIEIQRRMAIFNKQNSVFASIENEAHSDRFASAFGMGDQLASFLFKLYKLSSDGKVSRYKYKHDEIGCVYTWFSTYSELMKAIMYFTLPSMQLLIPGLIVTMPMIAIIGIVLPILILLMSIGRTVNIMSHGQYTYDNPMDRIIRIKHNTVGLLKTLNLSKNEMKNILDRIDTIDIMVKEFDKTSFLAIINKLVGISTVEINSWMSLKTSPYLGIERQLEQLLNNDLYTASARVKTTF